MVANKSAQMELDGETYVGTQTNLPCYIETFKTFDKHNYYKSADIAQANLCLITHVDATSVTISFPRDLLDSL